MEKGPPSPSPMYDHFTEALCELCYANWGEIDKKLKRLISLFGLMQAKGVLTNWSWYELKFEVAIYVLTEVRRDPSGR